MLEVEAGILEGVRCLDYRLSNVLDLLLTCDCYGMLVGLMRKLDGQLEQRSGIWIVMGVLMLVRVSISSIRE
jgi:hypothetical protein